MVELLKQGQYVPMILPHQVMVIWAGTEGFLDDVPTEKIEDFEKGYLAFCAEKYPDIEATITKEKVLSDAIVAKLTESVEKFKEQFLVKE